MGQYRKINMVEKPYKYMYIFSSKNRDENLAKTTTFEWNEDKNRLNQKSTISLLTKPNMLSQIQRES